MSLHLFVRNISKDMSKDTIRNVFDNYGFGNIKDIIFPIGKRNNPFQDAIVLYNSWDLENTQCTRSILSDGRHLTICTEDDIHPWKAFAYEFDRKQLQTILFPDILLPNVTDNRKQRHKRNGGYSLFPDEDDECPSAPKKQKTTTEMSREILSRIRQQLFTNTPSPQLDDEDEEEEEDDDKDENQQK